MSGVIYKPYGKKHLAFVAARVGERWPVHAKFPPTTVTDRWLKWKQWSDYLRTLKAEAAYKNGWTD
jgi:hypothetical protein